jgi:hypothetical protein
VTEYEIADLTASVMANYLTSSANFFALLTAYLAAAFVVGTRLSRAQVAFVNVCFVVFASMSAFMGSTMLSRALVLNSRSMLERLGTAPSWSGPAGFVGNIVLSSALIVGCLWFMRSIRKGEA